MLDYANTFLDFHTLNNSVFDKCTKCNLRNAMIIFFEKENKTASFTSLNPGGFQMEQLHTGILLAIEYCSFQTLVRELKLKTSTVT